MFLTSLKLCELRAISESSSLFLDRFCGSSLTFIVFADEKRVSRHLLESTRDSCSTLKLILDLFILGLCFGI